MKKILFFVLLAFCIVLLCGCGTEKETVNTSVEMMDLKDFYSKEYLKVYYDHENELPSELDYQESYMMYEDITDPELIEQFFTALMGIKIGEKTDIDITDAERNYWFTYADGTTISFHMLKADKDMLIYSPSERCNYVITDDNGLFKLSIDTND